MQMEFDRIIVGQDAYFLAVKLQWLEVVPKLIALAEAEKATAILHYNTHSEYGTLHETETEVEMHDSSQCVCHTCLGVASTPFKE